MGGPRKKTPMSRIKARTNGTTHTGRGRLGSRRLASDEILEPSGKHSAHLLHLHLRPNPYAPPRMKTTGNSVQAPLFVAFEGRKALARNRIRDTQHGTFADDGRVCRQSVAETHYTFVPHRWRVSARRLFYSSQRRLSCIAGLASKLRLLALVVLCGGAETTVREKKQKKKPLRSLRLFSSHF